jgi:carbamoyl-phosphate synthase large subunit
MVTDVNVLFTSVGRRVELIRAFRRAYADLNMGGRIIAVDREPLAPAIQEADRGFVVPPLTERRYITSLVEICRRENVTLVVPLIDPDVSVLGRNRGEIESTGARLLVVPDEAIAVSSDKLRTYGFFRACGVPTPRTMLPDEGRFDGLRFPVFVKPRFGSGGEQAVKVRDPRELAFFLGYVDRPIVQEYLPGSEITNDVFCDLDANVVAVVSRQRIEVRWGEVSKGVTIRDAQIMEHCVAIAKALAAVGPITVQCIRRGERAFFTEVNPRFGGGVPLSVAAGVPSPTWLLALTANKQIQPPPLGTYETGLYLSRFDDSSILTEEELARVASSVVRP